MAKVTEKDIKNVFDGLLGVVEKENLEMFKAVIGKRQLKLKEIEDYEDFFLDFVYPQQNFLQGMIKHLIPEADGKLDFIMLNSTYVENHFRNLIEKYEGSACSADKSRGIMRRLCIYLKNGTEIKWDYEAEYTYGMPKRIFTTHDDIVNFYDAIKSFYYGGVTQFLLAYKNVIDNMKPLPKKDEQKN